MRLLTTYRPYLPHSTSHEGLEVQVPAGSTAGDLLARLGVPLDEPHVVLVNGRHAETDWVLKDGDTVASFPAVAGG